MRSQEFEKVVDLYNDRMSLEEKASNSLSDAEFSARRDEFLLSIGYDVAIFLNNLIKSTRPKFILELGTSYGFSTLWLAEAAALYGGKVISIDIDADKSNFAKLKLTEAKLSHIVSFEVIDALEYLKSTSLMFEFVLLDIWKELYVPCFNEIVPKLSKGGWLVSDNIISPLIISEI
ncbi:MAG: class I SAM-dependent methyltransferase [Saprospiraceae bacterium]|nr:class I SAM-dependent methyltransferase [Saprospiraceae bacterium]